MQKPAIRIEWCNLSTHSNSLLTHSFAELQRQLQDNYPRLPALKFVPLQPELIGQLPEYLLAMMPGKVQLDSYPNLENKRVFVFCEEHEGFVHAYQDQNPLAHWGIAIPCKFAIAWRPNKYLLWHEVLHLVNAKDCYNKFAINKCQNAQCIMRLAPTHINCGGRLNLCSKNQTRITQFAINEFDLQENSMIELDA